MNSLPAIFLSLTLAAAHAADDVVLADFEGADYGAWQAEGAAFGSGPAHGALPGQMAVEGFAGKGLANSFNGGDEATGRLVSAEFKIERPFINFLIGGGGYAGETCMNLLVDGAAVRTATGPNTQPGGNENLQAAAWDVRELGGKTARIEIVDKRKGGWGHINVDQIVLSERRAAGMLTDAKREIAVSKRLLHFPVKTGAPKRQVKVLVDGKVERFFDIELANAQADWWAPLDVSAWTGKSVTVIVDKLPEDSQALVQIEQGDALKNSGDLYHEALRPQLQFSPQRGWTNDPNGLVFYKGEYHLFFQHNPYGWGWGNMHWGHATSADLVHWQEHGEALFPDAMGPMFSGSAVVDWKNTSGFGKDGQPPLVLIYTAAGNPAVQGLAYSNDGRTFTKFAGNPVIKEISGGNRDPKVFWHEATKQWVLTLYVELPAAPGGPKPNHTIHFFTSPNLREWTLRSVTPGLFECPDFFELPVDGDAAKKKWVLTAASSEYLVGAFDGEKFTPETGKLPGHRGRGFYAAQTFSDLPDGRRVQIGWGQCDSPGMAFNQLQEFPCELSLRSTPDGPRLAWQPVKELATLRTKSQSAGPLTLRAGGANPLAETKGELLEIRADFAPAADSEVVWKVRGIEVRYSAAKQEISVAGQRAPAPLRDGHQRVIILTDRTNLTVWASDGLSYVPVPVIAKAGDLGAEMSVQGGDVEITTLEAHRLKSIWP